MLRDDNDDDDGLVPEIRYRGIPSSSRQMFDTCPTLTNAALTLHVTHSQVQHLPPAT